MLYLHKVTWSVEKEHTQVRHVVCVLRYLSDTTAHLSDGPVTKVDAVHEQTDRAFFKEEAKLQINYCGLGTAIVILKFHVE